MTKGCYWDALSYEFDEDGHTVMRCKLNRKICPGYKGKCPALEAMMMVCNNPCGAGVSSFCSHSIPHVKNTCCPINEDCNCTGGGKIARCVPFKKSED